MGLVFESNIVSIFCVGDSHCLPLSDFVLFEPESGTRFVTRSVYIKEFLAASQFMDQNGQINNILTRELVRREILNDDGSACHYSKDPTYSSTTFIRSQPALAPPIIVFAGEVDLSFVILRQFERYDFTPPNASSMELDPSRIPVPYQAVYRAIETDVAKPLFAALTELRRLGFKRIAIHALPPRSADESNRKKWLPDNVSTNLRNKMVKLVNAVFLDLCLRNGFPFIDPWPFISHNDFIRPEFELDGLHVNRDAAKISLELIVANLFEVGIDHTNSSRYEAAWLRAGGLPQPVPERKAICMQGRFPEIVEQCLHLQYDITKRIMPLTLDWTSAGVGNHDSIRFAEPTQALLDHLCANVLPHIPVTFPSIIFSARPFCVISGAVTFTAQDPVAPTGFCRAFLLISNARLEFSMDQHQDVQIIDGTPGTVVMLDRSDFSITVGQDGTQSQVIDMWIGPRMENQLPRVIYGETNLWPNDPFNYSVSGFKSSPIFDSSVVNISPHFH